MSITAVPPGKKHRKKNKKAQKALKPQWSTYKRIAVSYTHLTLPTNSLV